MAMMRIQASTTSTLTTYAALLPLHLHLHLHLHLVSRQKPSILFNFRRRPFSSNAKFLSKPSHAPMSMSFSVRAARRRFSSQELAPAAEEEFASPEDLSFEPPLMIVEYPDPILRAKNKRINTFDDRLKKLVDQMLDVMYKTDGIGLSAPQVGINVQLMVLNPAGERGEGEEIVLVNPVVYKASKKTILYNEGCLSFPGIYADVERPASVKIDARDITGAKFKVNLSGLPARVFQHEFDHLQGTLFFDRMCKDVLDSIRAELKALEKKYEERTGQPTPERVDDYEGIKCIRWITAGKVDMVDDNIPGVLEVYSVGVEAVSGRIDSHVEDLDGFTVVELEVALWAVLDCYARDRHIITSIEPQSLPQKHSSTLGFLSCFPTRRRVVDNLLKVMSLTVGLMLGIFPLSSALICRQASVIEISRYIYKGIIYSAIIYVKTYWLVIPLIICPPNAASALYDAAALDCDASQLGELEPLQQARSPSLGVCRSNDRAI